MAFIFEQLDVYWSASYLDQLFPVFSDPTPRMCLDFTNNHGIIAMKP